MVIKTYESCHIDQQKFKRVEIKNGDKVLGFEGQIFGWIIDDIENVNNPLFIKGHWSSTTSLDLSDYHLYFLEFFFENIIQ